MMRLSWLLVFVLGSAITVGAGVVPDGKPHAFTFGGTSNQEFVLDGKPFQIMGGEMHPARIPHQYWRHRIQMAKAMGLNTVPIYVFWNDHEREPGKFDFTTDERNIGDFLDIARQEGMWVLLRPGPYICGEWDLGGLPWWLLRTPDIKLRSMDPRYTEPLARYFHALAEVVRPRMAVNGGPILMVQLENEYGSYSRQEQAHMLWLRDLWVKDGIAGPFFTADGYGKGTPIPGVAIGMDPGMEEKYYQDTHLRHPGVPVFSAETYPGGFRHGGEGNWSSHDLSGALKTFFVRTGKSFSLYVVHGGTSFGLTAGANNGGEGYLPDVTSYDYGAPINEQGRPTKTFLAMRGVLAGCLPAGEKLPELPEPIPVVTIPGISMTRLTTVWEQLPKAITNGEASCFESLGQNQGMMVYRTKINAGDWETLSISNLHDYAQVFVDGRYVGILDRRLGQHSLEIPARDKEATLEILVEAMGHINFSIGMESDRKGMYGGVGLGGKPLDQWEMIPVPLTDEWASSLGKTSAATGRPGGVFRGEFTLDKVADTFFDVSKYKKGYVWINGHNLGRYWSIGPQLRLYCPGPWLKQGKNTFLVLDLEKTVPSDVEGKGSAND